MLFEATKGFLTKKLIGAALRSKEKYVPHERGDEPLLSDTKNGILRGVKDEEVKRILNKEV